MRPQTATQTPSLIPPDRPRPGTWDNFHPYLVHTWVFQPMPEVRPCWIWIFPSTDPRRRSIQYQVTVHQDGVTTLESLVDWKMILSKFDEYPNFCSVLLGIHPQESPEGRAMAEYLLDWLSAHQRMSAYQAVKTTVQAISTGDQ